MNRKHAKIILTTGRVLINPVIPILAILAIREIAAPHLTETVGAWSVIGGFGIVYLAMLVVSFASSSIEQGIVAVIATLLGATALGEPYNRWDYYGACFAFGGLYCWVFLKITKAFDRMEKGFEQPEAQQEKT